MQFLLGSFPINQISFASKTELMQRELFVNPDELKALLHRDESLEKVELDLARPGERTRIIHVLDTIEPRIKIEGPGCVFPGILGPLDPVGQGITYQLAGVAVMVSARLPRPSLGGLLMAREAIVDMSGPAAGYSPFSSTQNLVLVVKLKEGMAPAEADNAVRLAGLKAACYLAEVTRTKKPDKVESFELKECDPSLPRVVYINQVHSGQGIYASTLLYGRALGPDLVPTFLHPNELMDGALVNGNYVYAAFKIPTYLHCNNGVISELYREHGRKHNFLGVILSRGHNYSYFEKERSANLAARLAKLLGAQGGILTYEGGGNSAIDAMLTVKAAEKMGIKLVTISYELGGESGTDDSLVDSVPEADAMVSAGSVDCPLILPEMTKVIGGQELLEGGAAAESFRLAPLYPLYCAANQTGAGRLTCQEA